MAVKNIKQIITDEDELSKIDIAEELSWSLDDEKKLLKEIVASLKATMKQNNLSSLSAPMIGYNKRVFCIDFQGSEVKTFINPLITRTEKLTGSREECSSIPGKQFIVPRFEYIEMYYQRPDGTIKHVILNDVAAFTVQHELNHLDGILLSDLGLEVESDFDTATKEEQEEIINIYLESLKTRQDITEDIISSNEESDTFYKRLKFIQAYERGDIDIIDVERVKTTNEKEGDGNE